MSEIRLTPGYIARHTPPGAGAQGRDAAIVDIAQDLLLRELHRKGVLDRLAFKGGTALRKLYAGTAGRFSLDLDFSVAQVDDDPDDVMAEVIAAADGLSVGPFAYHVVERRGKWNVTYDHTLGGEQVALTSKLDISPPPWLPPVRRGWVPLPIHQQYGEPKLPDILVVPLIENLAEKVSRLNRTTTARDMYDLAWIATNPAAVGPFDEGLLRRLAVLKVWVDANGVRAGRTFWKPSHEGPAFDVLRWLRLRTPQEIDIEDIGALSVPVPTAKELAETVTSRFRFLADMDETEEVIAQANERDRALVLHELTHLPGYRLDGMSLY